MILTPEQINKFKEINKEYGTLPNYSDEQIIEVANGVANYYLTLYKVYQSNKKSGYAKKPDG